MTNTVIYETVDNLLTYLYALEEKEKSRESGRVVMLHIEHCLRNESQSGPGRNTSKLGFPFVIELMEKIDLTKVGAHCMIGIVRSTFRVKQLIPGWDSLLKKIKAEMIRRNMDYKSLLIGLI